MNLRVATVILLSLPLPTFAAAPESAPPVTRAVIYPDRALITRALDASCVEGPSVVVFKSLPSDLDPTTLQAATDGTGARVEGVQNS